MDTTTTLVATGVVSSGLMSGLLYGWSVSVIPGTRRIPDAAYVTTMQDINRAIINPLFVIPFLGIPAVLGIASYLLFRAGDHRRAWLLAGASATYVVGVLGVTFGRNIPLNDALDSFDLRSASAAALSERRNSYESPWNQWHHVRTLASFAAFGLAAAAAVVASDGD